MPKMAVLARGGVIVLVQGKKERPPSHHTRIRPPPRFVSLQHFIHPCGDFPCSGAGAVVMKIA